MRIIPCRTRPTRYASSWAHQIEFYPTLLPARRFADAIRQADTLNARTDRRNRRTLAGWRATESSRMSVPPLYFKTAQRFGGIDNVADAMREHMALDDIAVAALRSGIAVAVERGDRFSVGRA